jgi:hypothetical protein
MFDFMNKIKIFTLIAICVVGAIAAVGILYKLSGNTTAANVNASQNVIPQQSAAQSQQSNSSQKILFSSTPYYNYAYLISTANISNGAKAALSGFNLSETKLSNGTSEYKITLSATGASQVLYLKKGYNLYMIEASYGDDGLGNEYSISDDGFVVVNQSGYLLG